MNNTKPNTPAPRPAKPKPKTVLRAPLRWLFFIVAVCTAFYHILSWYADSIGSRGTHALANARAGFAEIPCSRCHGAPNLVATCPICGGTGVIKVDPARLHNTNATRRAAP